MSRRLARTRLFALNAFGQDVTDTAGAGSLGAIGSQTQTREGSLITTDFQIDFGSAASPMSSSATVGLTGAGTEVINDGSADGGQILQLSNTTHGIVAEVELICVEAPTGGEDNIGVWRGDNISGSGAQMNLGGTELIAAAVQTVGLIGNDLPDADLAGKYIYLASSGSTHGTYTAGKFILRVYGYPVFDDV